jgi:Shwachman-Bodian-Diamond syndrome (SBDS) protein
MRLLSVVCRVSCVVCRVWCVVCGVSRVVLSLSVSHTVLVLLLYTRSEVFGTENTKEVCKIIVEQGELQVSAAERKEAVQKKRKEIGMYILTTAHTVLPFVVPPPSLSLC